MSTRRHLLQTLLAAGCAPALLSARAASANHFALGLASGTPRADRVVLWTRLVGPALPAQCPVQWELAEDEGFSRIAAHGEETALAEEAHSVHAEPQGLRPDRWYWYRFRALGQQSPVGRTRTAPAADAPVGRLRLAIASCQRWDHGRYAAWGDVAGQDLDLLLFLGDYIYESPASANPDAPRRHQGGTCHSLADYRARYAQYKGDPQLQAAHAAAPWINVWDDHEVANDFAGLVGQDLAPDFPARRAAAMQAYWEHMPFPRAWKPRDNELRLYHRLDWGSLARILTLDDRQWRDPQACPKPGRAGSNTVNRRDCPALDQPQRSLLGAAQEQWLARQWDRERPWNLLAQQTLMARCDHGSANSGERYWTDGWDGYPAARRRLLQDMQAAQARNPVVLGGDVHAHYVADLKQDFERDDAPVIASEFCGSSISSEGLPQARLDGLRARNPHLQLARSDVRGYVLFELQAGQLQARLRQVDDPWDAASPVRDLARYVVEAGRPGPQPA